MYYQFELVNWRSNFNCFCGQSPSFNQTFLMIPKNFAAQNSTNYLQIKCSTTMSNNNNNRQFYTPQEETGFTDPLGNCNDFNLLNFINSGEDTPIDSPAMEQRYFHAEQSTSRQPQPVIRQQPLYYNPVVTIPQQIPNQQLKVSPGSEYQASNSTYSAASSSNAQGESPVNGQVRLIFRITY